jgi:prepilin-type processing-associated H-X9-DG protein
MTARLDTTNKPLVLPYISNRFYLTKITDRITPEMVSAANTTGSVLRTAIDATGEKPRVMVAAEIEVACDAIISGGQMLNGEPVGGYGASGGWTGRHVTSHMRGAKPLGGNILFLDGHVIFRPWKDMFHRTTMGGGPQTIRFYY